MAETIRKILTTAVKSVEGKDRVLEFVGSTEQPDRDNEVIKASAWVTEKYVKNPVVQWAHDYRQPPIGKTISIKQAGGQTIFEIEFADKETYEFADTIFRLCKGGFLNATSVGFIPLEVEKGKKETDPTRTFNRVELLEISIVPVPSNPDALVTAREAGLITVKEFAAVNSKPDIEAVKVAIAEAEIVDTTKHEAKEVSQEEIKDEIDYLAALIEKSGLSDDNSILLKRVAGSDMPVAIKGVRQMVEPIMKMMDEHHQAHNKCNSSVRKALQSMCEGEHEEEKESIVDFVQKEIERQIKEIT